MRPIISTFLLCGYFLSHAQDSLFLKVHFLYGSKPLAKYKSTETDWFGGIWGGHVGIEGDSNQVLNFLPKGKFHIFPKPNDRHSHYVVRQPRYFYMIFGGKPDSVKKAIVTIPITAAQKHTFDSIASTYQHQTPYDYALFGMRCGAATYDILSQLKIVSPVNRHLIFIKIFYPKRLRKILFRKAAKYGWEIATQSGSRKRKWEKG